MTKLVTLHLINEYGLGESEIGKVQEILIGMCILQKCHFLKLRQKMKKSKIFLQVFKDKSFEGLTILRSSLWQVVN